MVAVLVESWMDRNNSCGHSFIKSGGALVRSEKIFPIRCEMGSERVERGGIRRGFGSVWGNGRGRKVAN